MVFVGAPDANSRLRELAPLQHFAFKSAYEEPRFGIGGIMNLQPATGEESIYFGSGRPYTLRLCGDRLAAQPAPGTQGRDHGRHQHVRLPGSDGFHHPFRPASRSFTAGWEFPRAGNSRTSKPCSKLPSAAECPSSRGLRFAFTEILSQKSTTGRPRFTAFSELI